MSLPRPVVMWGPVAAVIAAITAGAVLRSDGLERVVWDKALHAGGYAILGLLALRATHGGRGDGLRLRPSVGAGVLTIGHGAFVEILQSFIPWRDASLGDLAADSVGFACAVALAAAWSLVRRP